MSEPGPATEGSDASFVAAPFWHRLSFFLSFPLARGPVGRSAVSAAAVAIGTWSSFQLLGGHRALALAWLAFACGVGFVLVVRFGFVVIERTAAGYLAPSQYPPDLDDGVARAWKLMAVGGGVSLLVAVVGTVAPGGGLRAALIVALALWLPAATLMLARTDRLAGAFDAVQLLVLVRIVGGAYVAPCLLVLVLVVGMDRFVAAALPWLLPSTGTAAGAPAPGAGAALAVLMTVFAGNTLFLALCALLGYLLYQFSTPLGIAVVGPGEAAAGGMRDPRAQARRQREVLIGQLVARGEIREAIELVRSDLADRPTDLALNGRLLKLLVTEGATPRIETHTQRYLELLVKTGNWRQALDLLEDTFARMPKFEPRETAHVLPLARAAVDATRMKLAARLVRGFDRRHPRHPEVPAAYLLGARILMHTGRDAEKARHMLEVVAGRFPGTPAALEAGRLLERFGALAKPAPPPLGDAVRGA